MPYYDLKGNCYLIIFHTINMYCISLFLVFKSISFQQNIQLIFIEDFQTKY